MKTYSIWMSEDKETFTLVEGIFPGKFLNGTVDNDCFERILVFKERNWKLANKFYNHLMSKADIFIPLESYKYV